MHADDAAKLAKYETGLEKRQKQLDKYVTTYNAKQAKIKELAAQGKEFNKQLKDLQKYEKSFNKEFKADLIGKERPFRERQPYLATGFRSEKEAQAF